MAGFLGISVYVWVALISLVFLILLASLGHYGFGVGHDVDVGGGVDHDFGQFTGPGVSPLSPPLLAAFGTTFGSVGALLEAVAINPILVALGAALVAFVVALGLFFLIQRYLVEAQTSSDVVPETLVGRDATVLIPISAGQNGQILVITEERGRSLFPATAREEIPRDAHVEIIGFMGGVANVRKKLA